MQPPPMPPPSAAVGAEKEHDEDLVPHPPSQQRTKPEPEPEPELEPVAAAATNSTHAVAFDGADAAPLTFSVNHFGLRGRRAGPGVKRGDFVTTWRERYFVLHEDGNFLVYFLSASESEPRGALPLGGGTVEATDDRDGCGLRLKLRGTGENLLAFDTTAERDAWLQVLQQASAEAYVDSIANRALLPLLPTLPARAQSVFFGAPGALARHTLGTGLMPEDWAASSELGDEHWCVLCPDAQFIWLFRDQQLSKTQGLVALEGCEVMDSSEFEIGAGFGTDPGVEAEGAASSTVLAIRHHLRSVHIFRFGDAGVCAAWRAQLQRVCKETTWRGEERLQEEQREKDSKGQGGGGGGRGPGAGEEAAAAERLRPAGGKLAEVAAEAAREAAWTNEADEAFKLKFKEAQAKPDYGWGPADLLAYTAESIASGVEAVNEVIEWMPVGVDKETPSILAITREFMGRMTTEEQLAM